MKAFIFAAGKSSRLKAINGGLPKACINLTKDLSIIDRLLSQLNNDFSEVNIILGFGAEQAKDIIRKKWEGKTQFALNFIINDDFENKDNIYSAYLIRQYFADDTLIFNSDIVIDDNILTDAIRFAKESKNSFLVVDDHKPSVDEDMKIYINENKQVTRIAKSLDNSQATGEYIGLLRIASADAQIYSDKLAELITNQDHKRHYEYALDLVLEKITLNYLSTSGYPWTEIDTEIDLERAKNLVCVK